MVSSTERLAGLGAVKSLLVIMMTIDSKPRTAKHNRRDRIAKIQLGPSISSW
jgi:hypothetical protein